MVIVHHVGGLGNQLFQYALGRILAESLGLALCRRPAGGPMSFLPGGEPAPYAGFDELGETFPGAQSSLSGTEIASPEETVTGPHRLRRNGTPATLDEILADRTPRRIALRGFFQRYEYYQAHKADIRRWFATDSARGGSPAIDDRDILVSIRRGDDFGALGWVLSLEYYMRTLERMRDRGRVYLCGTGITPDVLDAFGAYEPSVVGGTPVEQLRSMTRFRRIVLSNSTFAWWGAFLSSATEIYVPVGEGTRYTFSGYRSAPGEVVELLPREEPRFIPVHDPPFASMSLYEVSQGSGARLEEVSPGRFAVVVGEACIEVPRYAVPMVDWCLGRDRLASDELFQHMRKACRAGQETSPAPRGPAAANAIVTRLNRLLGDLSEHGVLCIRRSYVD